MHSSILKGWVGRGALSLALLVGAMAVFLMMGGLGEGQQACGVDECIEYPEHGSGTVIAFTGVDPEGEPVSWRLDTNSLDDEHFNVEGGRLTFKTPPDFESPRDSGPNNEYDVTVIANDGTSTPTTRSIKVTVTNVEEAGTVALSSVQPKEGVALTADLTDPDNVTRNNVEWKWERSERATGPWADVDDEETEDVEGRESTYRPTEDDVGMYLRATATYEDGHCTACAPKKTAQVVSVNAVAAKDYVNQPPVFKDSEGVAIPEGLGIERSIAENSPAGTAVGEPVVATDQAEFGPDVLTYSLGGADGSSFSIDRGTGQIRVRASINYEDSNNEDHEYTVEVTATDSSGAPYTDTIEATIYVTNVDEPPTFTTAATTLTHAEFTGTGNPVLLIGDNDTYKATDPEDNPEEDTSPGKLRWSLTGRDANKFIIRNDNRDRGKLYFKEAPDYEARSDANRDNNYEVRVEVTDRGGNKAIRDVVVEVDNVDETGTLMVSNEAARVGNRITATLVDPDTSLSQISWEWKFGNTVVSRTSSYTPKEADKNSGILRLDVEYVDGTGERQTDIQTKDLSAVSDKSPSNQRPEFGKSTDERSVPENAAAATDVGDAVEAIDQNNGDRLTYSISGTDAALFSILQDTGQIKVRQGTLLNRERKSSYRVTVTAEDPNGLRDSLSLTIRVTEVDEPPVITSGFGTIYYAENGTVTVGTYVAEDPERETIEWALTGVDNGLFTIDGGQLKFKTPPDYESPSGGDNTYNVTVRAGDGNSNNNVDMAVEVMVDNVDEAGTVSGLPERPKEDVQITAELSDPDGNTSNVGWQWPAHHRERGLSP